jgi:TPR repeat protein
MKSAIFYYQKAVEEIGYLEAALALARIYYYGIGVPADSKLAAQYYKAILALTPNPIANLMLGRMHRLGEGVEKDLYQAEEFLGHAAEADNVYAIRELAMLRRQQKRWVPALQLALKAGWRAFRIGLRDLHDPRLRQAQVRVSRPRPRAISADIARAVKSYDLTERMKQQGMEPIGSTPEQFDALIRSEIEKWAKVVRLSGARVD